MSSNWVRSVLQIKLGKNWKAVKEVYQDLRIPIYVRHFLAEWIETEIVALNPREFLCHLRQKCADIPLVFLSDGSIDFPTALNSEYTDNPELLQSKLKWCLHEEARIVMQDEESWKQSKMEKRGEDEKIKDLQGTFGVIQDLLSKINVLRIAGTPGPEASTYYLLQQNEVLTFQQAQAQLYAKIVGLLAELTILVRGYFRYAVEFWEYERKKWFIGNKEMSSKDSLIEADAQRLHVALRYLNKMVRQDEVFASGGSSLISYVFELQEELLNLSVYIDDIPLIMTGSKYPVKIGFLVIPAEEFEPTERNIGLDMKVLTQETRSERGQREKTKSCSPENAAAEDSLLKVGGVVLGHKFSTKEDTRGKRRNSTKDNTVSCKNHFFVWMDNFTLKKMDGRREGNPQGDSVTDQLVYICVSGFIHFDDWDFTFRKLSIPHVVTTNNSQNWKAWATILRNYGFSNFPEISTETPEAASWEKILDVIGKFYSDKTKLTLNEQQLEHLTKRGGYLLNKDVNLKEFFKKKTIFKYPGKRKEENYSFWRWFYGAIKMIEQMQEGHLSEGEKWITSMDKYFMGFISKSEAEKLLNNARKGTFLLRFSDSTPSGISVVVNIDKGIPRHIQPFTKDCLPLSAKIISLTDAVCLYPDTYKSIVFESDSSRTEVSTDPKKVPYVSLDPSTSVKHADYTQHQNGIQNQIEAMDIGEEGNGPLDEL